MITWDSYSTHLKSNGGHLGEVRKNKADMIMNATFTGDIGYRRVYILDKDEGWHYTDAKFSKHATPSVSKDAVDSYLQFRPKEHHSVGSYVFIPDDTSYELNINEENPLHSEATNLWMIVGRDDQRQFVQYMLLKCNYLFRWVQNVGDKKEIYKCWGCVRDSASYTSCNNTARCIGKPCSVSLRICWDALRAVTPKRKDETGLDGRLRKLRIG